MVLASWGGRAAAKSTCMAHRSIVVTVAEFHLSPMGLSMVTKLAPRRDDRDADGRLVYLGGGWQLSVRASSVGSPRPLKTSDFFALLVATSLRSAAVLLLVSQYRRLKAAMPYEGLKNRKATSCQRPQSLPFPEAGY